MSVMDVIYTSHAECQRTGTIFSIAVEILRTFIEVGLFFTVIELRQWENKEEI